MAEMKIGQAKTAGRAPLCRGRDSAMLFAKMCSTWAKGLSHVSTCACTIARCVYLQCDVSCSTVGMENCKLQKVYQEQQGLRGHVT